MRQCAEKRERFQVLLAALGLCACVCLGPSARAEPLDLSAMVDAPDGTTPGTLLLDDEPYFGGTFDVVFLGSSFGRPGQPDGDADGNLRLGGAADPSWQSVQLVFTGTEPVITATQPSTFLGISEDNDAWILTASNGSWAAENSSGDLNDLTVLGPAVSWNFDNFPGIGVPANLLDWTLSTSESVTSLTLRYDSTYITNNRNALRLSVDPFLSIEDGVAADYPFTGNVWDESGNGLDGVSSGAELVDDRCANQYQAYAFDGLGAHLDMGDILNIGLPLTVSFWIHVDSTPPFGVVQDILASDAYLGVDPYGIAIGRDEGRLRVELGEGPTGTRVATTSPAALSTGVWTHVVVVARSPSDVSIFVDGVDLVSIISGSGSAVVHSADPFLVAAPLPGHWAFDGQLDELRIYDRAIENFEVALLQAQGCSQPPPVEGGIEWVDVGDPGNAFDSSGFGSVAEVFRIAKHEVTNKQYAQFLNSAAASDPNGLFDVLTNTSPVSGIGRTGQDGSYRYCVSPQRQEEPVGMVSYYSALRFANWMHNGQPVGPQDGSSTEDGAYTMAGESYPSGPFIERNPGASVYLPDEDEWYKAAYYDSDLQDYFDFPTSEDLSPACVPPIQDDGNAANCASGPKRLAAVGSYSLSMSPFGSLDQGGNVAEWVEEVSGLGRVVRGGSFRSQGPGDLSSSQSSVDDPALAVESRGFRVASRFAKTPPPQQEIEWCVDEAAMIPTLPPLGYGLLGLMFLMAGSRALKQRGSR